MTSLMPVGTQVCDPRGGRLGPQKLFPFFFLTTAPQGST